MKEPREFYSSKSVALAVDPFDKKGHVDNPNNYTLDTSYTCAAMQGIKGLLG